MYALFELTEIPVGYNLGWSYTVLFWGASLDGEALGKLNWNCVVHVLIATVLPVCTVQTSSVTWPLRVSIPVSVLLSVILCKKLPTFYWVGLPSVFYFWMTFNGRKPNTTCFFSGVHYHHLPIALCDDSNPTPHPRFLYALWPSDLRMATLPWPS